MKKEKKVRQYRSRQGRSDKQYGGSLIVFGIAFTGLVISVLIIKLT